MSGILRVGPGVLLLRRQRRRIGLPVALQPTVERVEDHVTEDWGGQPTLGRPGVGGQDVAFLHDPGFEPLADEVDAPLVCDALTQAVQDDAGRDGVNTLDQIAFDDPCGPGLVRLGHTLECLDRVPSGPKAVGAVPKDRFVNRCQDLGHRRWHHPIPDGRDA
jgi:hypothetical protein